MFGARVGWVSLVFWLSAILCVGSLAATLPVQRVQVTDEGIWFDSRHITLPCTVADLEAALGPPSAILPAHGDEYSKTVFEWEAQSMYAYMDPRSAEIRSIGISLSEIQPERHFKASFAGEILVNDVVLTPCSTISARGEAGFQYYKGWWSQTVGDYHLLWVADVMDDGPREFEINVH